MNSNINEGMRASHSNIVFSRSFNVFTIYILIIFLIVQIIISILAVKDDYEYSVILVTLIRFTDLFIYMFSQMVALE